MRSSCDSFSSDSQVDKALFIVYVLYLLFVYFFVWRLFLRNLMEELWRGKSLLR